MKENVNMGAPTPAARCDLMYHYEDRQPLPEFLSKVWHKHWIMIIVAALDFVVILYSIIGIMKVGFREAAGLFGIGIFVWFCLTWVVVREYCGSEIHNWLIKPVVDWVDNHWKYLKWYVGLLVVPSIICKDLLTVNSFS
jgi:hypothetical protein